MQDQQVRAMALLFLPMTSLVYYTNLLQRSVVMMFLTLGIMIFVSVVIVLARQAAARLLAPHPVFIRTAPKRRR